FNEGMIEEGRRHCPQPPAWVRGNAFQLPFDPKSFDLVYSFRFIRHFHSADRQRLYAQLKQVLRPGGYFMMDAVNERASKPWRRPGAVPHLGQALPPGGSAGGAGRGGV